MSLVVIGVAIFFAGMGLVGLFRPAAVWAPFGVTPTTPASRNEVRAVYGGYGVAVGVLLVAALAADADFRDGVLIAVAVSLGGMAVGRFVGFAVERPGRFYPTGLFLVLEMAMAAALVLAAA